MQTVRTFENQYIRRVNMANTMRTVTTLEGRIVKRGSQMRQYLGQNPFIMNISAWLGQTFRGTHFKG